MRLVIGVAKLEAAINESPEKSLAIPMLRKDIQVIAKQMDEIRATTRSEIEHTNDMQNRILGAIGAALLSVIASASWIIVKLLPGLTKEVAK